MPSGKGRKEHGDRYVVIMAGGSGKRLWPKSTSEKPKQFHRLVSPSLTLLQETFQRVRHLVPRENMYVSTTVTYLSIVQEQLPDVMPENIIIEPCSRDTAPAFAFIADMIVRKNPSAMIMTTPSDHSVKHPAVFADVARTMFQMCDRYPEKIGLMGIRPTEASTAFGYIEVGNEMLEGFSHEVRTVSGFVEKPPKDKAKKYFNDQPCFWNAGCFVFYANTMLEQITKHAPQIMEVLERMHSCQQEEERDAIFATLAPQAIDKAVIEKLVGNNELFVIPAYRVDWSDVGSWNTLLRERNVGKSGNFVRGNVYTSDMTDCLVFDDENSPQKPIVIIGVKDIVVVHTDHGTLIAHRDSVDSVKDVSRIIEQKNVLCEN